MAPFRGVAMAAIAAPTGAVAGDLAREVARRFQPSQIEMERTGRLGAVTRQGALLTLIAAMPAKPFLVIEVEGVPKALQHVMDFARVDVSADGTIQAESSLYTVPAGTEMVILDVMVSDAAVHLLAHTAEPLPVRAGGESVYGCTEFVFHFDPSALPSPDPLFDRIGEWLSGPTGERVCQGGVEPLCIEP